MKTKNKFIYILTLLIAGLFFCTQTTTINAARTDMVDVSNNNSGYMTVSNFRDMLNNYGIKSVCTKISEGTYYSDWTAATNIANAQTAGLYINGYHFARYTTIQSAINEADYSATLAKRDGLPVGAVLVADVESQQQNGLSKYQNNIDNQAFMNEVSKYGYRSTIYTMSSWISKKMDVSKGWIASYPYNAADKDWYSEHHAWQWTSNYQFSGSYGNFDVSQNYDDYFTGGQKPQIDPNDELNNNVTIKGDSYKAYATYSSSGYANEGTNVVSNSEWKSNGISIIDGTPYYIIGVGILIPQRITNYRSMIKINYRSDYGVLAYDSHGKSIKDSNKIFKGGTSWKVSDKLSNIAGVGYCYQVATDQFVPVNYSQGSGFNGD